MKKLNLKMKNSKGFILITTLIFLLILSIFAYQALESALLETKLQQTLERQKNLFDKAQKNLTSAEKTLRNYCPDSNKTKCVTVEKLDEFQYKIISKMSEGDQSVILQSICEAAKDKKQCIKRLSWEQLG